MSMPKCEDRLVHIIFRTGGPEHLDLYVLKTREVLQVLGNITIFMKPFKAEQCKGAVYLFDDRAIKDVKDFPMTFEGISEVIIKPMIYCD
jgi:hypothetical protein